MLSALIAAKRPSVRQSFSLIWIDISNKRFRELSAVSFIVPLATAGSEHHAAPSRRRPTGQSLFSHCRFFWSGKSSVARAGLVAALRRDDISTSSRWPVAICRLAKSSTRIAFSSLGKIESRRIRITIGAPPSGPCTRVHLPSEALNFEKSHRGA